jgi:hypothetical protein
MPVAAFTTVPSSHASPSADIDSQTPQRGPEHRRRHVTVKAAAMTAALCLLSFPGLAGCAGTSHSDQFALGRTPRSAFIVSVEAVCQRAVKAHDGHDFPLAQFDPLHPDPSQLPAVGDYFARYGQLPETVTALHDLTPPAADAAAWTSMLGLADRLTAVARRQIAAARDRNVSAFVSTVRTVKRLKGHIDAAGRRFGFGSESPCGQVFD